MSSSPPPTRRSESRVGPPPRAASAPASFALLSESTPDGPTPLLGGLTPARFMQRHWQKKPLLVRQAVPGGLDWVERRRLVALAANEDVESRLVLQPGSGPAGGWKLSHGPFARNALPPLSRPAWTLLVQGVDLHWPEARALLDRFRFVPDARLDDLMISYASDRGGVGPHLDSYDVFLLQARGRRRWRIGRARRPRLVPDVPLKLLANFEAEDEWLLEPGDLLYLPPGWGHDGVAEGECLTCSIGFRAPARDALAREVLQRLLDAGAEDEAEGEAGAGPGPLYRDPHQPAVDAAGRIPPALETFAADAIRRLLDDPDALRCALGEVLSEPKPGVRFETDDDAVAAEPGSRAIEGAAAAAPRFRVVDGAAARTASRSVEGVAPIGIVLAPPTRLLYDDRHVYINGEAFRAAGRDATTMRRLADRRRLSARELGTLSADARALVEVWLAAGWLRAVL